jgi:hypothetical protein
MALSPPLFLVTAVLSLGALSGQVPQLQAQTNRTSSAQIVHMSAGNGGRPRTAAGAKVFAAGAFTLAGSATRTYGAKLLNNLWRQMTGDRSTASWSSPRRIAGGRSRRPLPGRAIDPASVLASESGAIPHASRFRSSAPDPSAVGREGMTS